MSSRRISSLDELARDVPPPRDLWPAIESEMRVSKPAARNRSAVWRYGFGIAAAVGLVAIGVWVGRASLPVAGLSATAKPIGESQFVPATFSPDARFTRDRAALRVDLAARLAALPPESRDKVSASLDTIQAARTDIEAALGRDPGNALLHELLVNAYQDEMRVLTTLQEVGAAREEI